MEELSRQMAEGKAADCHRLKMSYPQKKEVQQKEKRSKKRKTCLEYGKLKEFPTFKARQTNNKLFNNYL